LERIIRVTGQGKISVPPDTTRLNFRLNGFDVDYSETLAKSASETEKLKSLLSELGINKSDIKTRSFDVNEESESYQEKKVWKRRFLGYSYTHRLKLEFPLDHSLLSRILMHLGLNEMEPEIDIEYIVKDPNPVKNQLLAKAIQDSKQKAEILANESGVKLGQILTIDYSWGEIEIRSTTRYMDMGMEAAPMMAKAEASFALDIEPEDIDLSDTVTVIYGID